MSLRSNVKNFVQNVNNFYIDENYKICSIQEISTAKTDFKIYQLTCEKIKIKKIVVSQKIYRSIRTKRFQEAKKDTPTYERAKIRQMYKNCPRGYEVDHIIPISKGGLHRLNNLQYLSKEENRKKKDNLIYPEIILDGKKMIYIPILPIVRPRRKKLKERKVVVHN